MTMSSLLSYRVRVGLPHYFHQSEGETGYGSCRRNARLPRSLALARCLNAMFALERQHSDLVLNIANRCLQPTPTLLRGEQLLPAVSVEVHVFTDGTHQLQDVLDLFAGRIEVHHLALENPRHLPLACRDNLINAEPGADLTIYTEDDLVINDPFFFDKQLWFLNQTNSQAVLMPHRYELIPGARGRRLLPDGPLKPELISRFYQSQQNVASGRFLDGQNVSFDRTTNPHSGMFCISTAQAALLREKDLPRAGFVSPLETAATLTVLQHFAVLKTNLAQRQFLWVEHAHNSYLEYLKVFTECQ